MVDLFVVRIIDLLTDGMVDLFVFVSTDRTVQYKLNAQFLRLFGVYSDVNDAHRAGANRLKKTKCPFKPDWRPTENKRSHVPEAETLRRPQTCRREGQICWIPRVYEKDGAEGIHNFLKGGARTTAQELRIPLEEAEDCINDLLEMETEELDPSREAKVIAAYQEMVGQWDKDVKPIQKVIEVEPETDDQSLSEECMKRRQTNRSWRWKSRSRSNAAASPRSFRRGTKSRKCALFWLKRLIARRRSLKLRTMMQKIRPAYCCRNL